MRQLTKILSLVSLTAFSPTYAYTYATQAGDDALDFQFDVPHGWEKMVGRRKSSTYASFFKADPAGKVSIEVYSYRADNANLELLLLQQRARLAVVFDRIYLQSSRATDNREDIRRHEWSAWLGKTRYRLVTSFLRTEDRVLKIFCVAPERRYRAYESIFENAVLSFSFADGKHDAGDALVAIPAQATVHERPRPQARQPAVAKPRKETVAPPNPRATEELFAAVKKRDLASVRTAIEQKAFINEIDAEGKSPLSYAVEQNDDEIAAFLREHGGLDAVAGRRMLRAIAANNPTEFVKAMDDSGDPNYADKFGNTPLIVAAAYGNSEILQTLLELKANIHAKDLDGYTALFYAAQENHVGIIDQLVAAGADLHATSRFGFTPLHIAAARGHLAAVKHLVQSGAGVNTVAKQGGTAAFWAAIAGHDEVADFLVKSGSVDYHHNRDLVIAAKTNNVQLAQNALRATEVNIDMQDIEGNSALAYAAMHGSAEVIAVLLQHGSNANLLNHEGLSPLLMAVAAGHNNAASLLLASRANTEAKDKYGRTAVMYAAWKGQIELLQELVRSGADVNRQDKAGWTALMFAAYSGNLSTVKFLVSGKAKTRTRNESRQTAHDIAQAQGSTEIAQLIKQGR